MVKSENTDDKTFAHFAKVIILSEANSVLRQASWSASSNIPHTAWMQKPSSLTHQSRAEPRWPLPIDALVIMMSAMISKMLMMITITLLAGSEAFWESTQRADPLSLPITSLPKVRHHCN